MSPLPNIILVVVILLNAFLPYSSRHAIPSLGQDQEPVETETPGEIAATETPAPEELVTLAVEETASISETATSEPTYEITETPSLEPSEFPSEETPTPTIEPTVTETPTFEPTATDEKWATVEPTKVRETATATPSPEITEAIKITPVPTQTAPVVTETLVPTETVTPSPTDTPESKEPVILDEETTRINKHGGEVTGLKGKVKIKFPEDAISEEVDIRIREGSPVYSADVELYGAPLEFTAESVKQKSRIHKFAKDIEIEIAYSDLELQSDPADLGLYYYNEDTQDWKIIPARLDRQTQTLLAVIDHFSLYSLGDNPWDKRAQPLDAAQVSSFTGSGSYSYPISVPEGPGGLQPTVSLNYSSLAVEGASLKTQASWVGMGWSLASGGSIMRDQGRRRDWPGDDTFALILGGVSYELIPISRTPMDYTYPNTNDHLSAIIDYKASDDTYWRIRRYVIFRSEGYGHEIDTWSVWDKTGGKYTFNYHAWYPEKYIDEDDCTYSNPCITMRVWGWFLGAYQNAAGQALTYTYNYESSMKCPEGDCGYPAMMKVAVYPHEIIYPDGVTRIEFTRERNRGDYDYSWDDNQTVALYETYNLNSIRVWVNGTILREYDLTYFSDAAVPILPGSHWDPVYDNNGDSGRVLTLQSIREYGIGGIGAGSGLLPVTFTYNTTSNWHANHLFLTAVNNGQGGQVEFAYEDGAALPWHAVDGVEGKYKNLENVSGRVLASYPYRELGSITTSPGTFYKISCVMQGYQETSTIRFFIMYSDGYDRSNSEVVAIPTSQGNISRSAYVYVPGNAVKARIFIEMVSEGGTFNEDCTAAPTVTHHRVLLKNVTDGMGSLYQWWYSYEGAKTNDTATSAFAALPSGLRKVKQNSVFRGHNKVIEMDQYGSRTETYYYQGDALNGRAYRVSEYNGAEEYSRVETSYQTTSGTYWDTSFCAKAGYTDGCFQDRVVYWNATSAVEQKVFQTSGGATGTRAEYSYQASQQGGTQYGNATHIVHSSWNGSAWKDERLELVGYYPTANDDRYLTGLPGYTNQYRCVNTTDGNCYDPGDPFPSTSNILSSVWSLYDDNTNNNTTPVNGMLTGKRTLLYYTDPAGFTSPRYADMHYDYDGWGNVTATTAYLTANATGSFGAGTGHTTSVAYDSTFHARVTQKINSAGQVEAQYQYNGNGGVCARPSRVDDVNGNVTRMDYDAFCRLVQVALPGDSSAYPTLIYEYLDTTIPHRVISRTRHIAGSNSGLKTERYYFQGLGWMVQSQQASASVDGSTQDIITDYQYDAYGRVVKQNVPYNTTTGASYRSPNFSDNPRNYVSTEYDVLGRITRVVQTNGQPESRYTYNGALETTVIDANGHTTRQVYDASGRVVETHPQIGPWTKYTYDALGRLIQAGQYELNQSTAFTSTTITYDYAGRKTAMNDPDLGAWTYEYDAVGNLKVQEDARGCVISMTYDLLNRLTNKAYTGVNTSPNLCDSTPDVSYSYDQGDNGVGQRSGMQDGSGQTTWSYDVRGRLVGEHKTITGAGTYFTQWEYTSDDQLNAMTYPGGGDDQPGERVAYTYHNQGGLNTVSGSTTYVQSSAYDSAGRLDARTYGAGAIQNEYNYSAWNSSSAGRLQSMTATTASATLQNLAYTYDAAGNILTIVDATTPGGAQTQTFTYDAIDRLQTARAVGGSVGAYSLQTYGYDARGRLSVMPGKGNYSYGAGHIHGVASVLNSSNVEIERYTYNASGSLVTRQKFGASPATLNLKYDGESRLIGSTNEATSTFVYDGDGQRVKATVDGVTTVYIGEYYEEELGNPNLLAGFEDDTAWSAALDARYPATDLYRATTGITAPYLGEEAYTSGNLAYAIVKSEAIQVNAGETYQVSGYVRGQIDADDSLGCWVIRARYYSTTDGSGTSTGYSNAASGCRGNGLGTGWAAKSGTVSIPSGVLSMRIELVSTQSNGWVAFDDIGVKKVGSSSYALNPATTGGFETSGDWQISKAPEYPGTAAYIGSWADAAPRSGTHALTIGNLPYGLATSNVILVTAGEQYTVSAMVRGEVDADDTLGCWIVRAIFYATLDGSGASVGYADPASGCQGQGLSGTTWAAKSGVVTIPAGALSMKIELSQGHGTGWVAFDNVGVKKVGSTSYALNPATTGGFETGAGWTITRISRYAATDAFIGTWGDAAPYAGVYALTIGNLPYGVIKSSLVAVSPGDEYDLTVYVRGQIDPEGSIGCWRVRATFLNASGSTLSVSDPAAGCDGAGISEDWQLKGGLVVVPAGAVSLRVELSNNFSTGWVSFDSPSLKRASVRKYYYAGGARIAMRIGSMSSGTNGLTWLLSDHLGSVTASADKDGNLLATQRYTPWGSTRAGSAPTTFGYTGQRSEEELGLIYFKARWFDPYLNRFLSPDPIIPDPYNPLDWDRYSYCRNNPINFNDPSGHWPTWPVPPVPPPYPIVSWLTGNAENVFQLIALGIAHTDDANIVGEGLQSLKDDPRVMTAHDKIIEEIRDFPEYKRNEPFVMEKYGNEKFQAMGNNENWREAAWEGNQAFFMVYTGTLSATNTSVSANGTISTTWKVSDNFDYLPDFENRGFEYNLYACINYFVYNVVLGAKEQYPTSAKWNETIPPPLNRKGGQQQK